jgi:hypothetical protein
MPRGKAIDFHNIAARKLHGGRTAEFLFLEHLAGTLRQIQEHQTQSRSPEGLGRDDTWGTPC